MEIGHVRLQFTLQTIGGALGEGLRPDGSAPRRMGYPQRFGNASLRETLPMEFYDATVPSIPSVATALDVLGLA